MRSHQREKNHFFQTHLTREATFPKYVYVFLVLKLLLLENKSLQYIHEPDGQTVYYRWQAENRVGIEVLEKQVIT